MIVFAPDASARGIVLSAEEESMTIISEGARSWERSTEISFPIEGPAFSVGMITDTFMPFYCITASKTINHGEKVSNRARIFYSVPKNYFTNV